MINSKLPLFKVGDVLIHDTYGFERKVDIIYEDEVGVFTYSCKCYGIPTEFIEDELLDEYSLLEEVT